MSGFVRSGRRAQPRRVELGEMGNAAVQVVGGLAAGERVVVFPSGKVHAGVRVALRE